MCHFLKRSNLKKSKNIRAMLDIECLFTSLKPDPWAQRYTQKNSCGGAEVSDRLIIFFIKQRDNYSVIKTTLINNVSH